MMKKQSQSLLDFINYLPLQAIQNNRSTITKKEAELLFDIFESASQDEYGNSIVPNAANQMILSSLISKGYVDSKYDGLTLGSVQRAVVITKKGKEIIKTMILSEEKSVFEKHRKKAETTDKNWLNKIS